MTKNLKQQPIESITDLGRKFSDATIFMHETIAAKAGLSGTDHKYIGFLIRKGAMTAGELATLTGLTTGAVTGLIDRLEKKRLVKREFDTSDRRKIIIVPDTKKISKLLNPSFDELRTKIVALISTFSMREQQIIEKYLVSTIEVMQEVTNTIKKK